jgi:hypothetical protein
MGFKPSAYDQIGSALASVLRKVGDVKFNLIGTKTNVIRITQTSDDVNSDGQGDLIGDKTNSYSSSLVSNVHIMYPFNEVELFQTMDSSSGQESVGAISLTELMPIKMYVPFTGDTVDSSRDFDQNDIIVDILFDHNGRKIPLIMTSPKLIGSLWDKYIVRKIYLLTFFRGSLEDNIQTHVDKYTETLGIPIVTSTYPLQSSINFPVSGSLSAMFNFTMYKSSVEENIRLVPSTPLTFYWDSDEDTVTINPTGNLLSGTTYVCIIEKDSLSSDRCPMSGDFRWSFKTI